MTSLNNPVKLPLDANGNVLANVNAQNITPNVNTVNNPTIANPYTPTLLSHQTGLSGTSSTANAPVNVGSSITAPRAGLARIRVFGHVSSGDGLVDFALTSAGITSYFNSNSSSDLSQTLFGDVGQAYFSDPSETLLYPIYHTYGNYVFDMWIPLEANDVLQFRVSNSTANDTTYIDDLEVLLI